MASLIPNKIKNIKNKSYRLLQALMVKAFRPKMFMTHCFTALGEENVNDMSTSWKPTNDSQRDGSPLLPSPSPSELQQNGIPVNAM